jgi:hypothetical protein
MQTSPFLEDAKFPWLAGASALLADLRDEVDACLAFAMPAAATAQPAVQLPLLDRGIEQYEARRTVPRLLAALSGLPLANVRNIAPRVEILALEAKARVAVHYGLSNSRCRALVNLAGSAAIEIAVGKQTRIVAAGESIAFDPCFGVAYANLETTAVRAIVMELWHPDLTGTEREALSTALVAALDFDTRMQELI